VVRHQKHVDIRYKLEQPGLHTKNFWVGEGAKFGLVMKIGCNYITSAIMETKESAFEL